MKILLCPDKFKGSLSAEQVCHAVREGLLSVDSNLEIISHPMADGGDGSIEILKSLLKLKGIKIQTLDGLKRNIEAKYYYNDDSAFIELASASGLVLLSKAERNPMTTSTLGTGLLMKDALERGFKKLYLFIGGSSTNDAGIGIAQALGFDFLDKKDSSLDPIGSNLGKIHKIVNNNLYNFENMEITVLCDVTNPMHGPNGAAFVYAAQKGANDQDIISLDEGLKNYSSVLKFHLNVDHSDESGMGAAGAVGASLVGLLNANLKNGFEMFSNITRLKDAIKKSDLVITGEGSVDQTSFQGKVVGNIVQICNKYHIPCGIIGGMLEEINSSDLNINFQKSIISIAKDLADAMTSSERFLNTIGKDIAKNEINYHSK